MASCRRPKSAALREAFASAAPPTALQKGRVPPGEAQLGGNEGTAFPALSSGLSTVQVPYLESMAAAIS